MPNDDMLKNNIRGSEYWINSSNKTFRELVLESRLYPEWGVSGHVFDSSYTSKFLIPVNRYAEIFHNKPELLVYDDHIRLRQTTHAEIWVEERTGGLYALDKCWQRQFYPSELNYENQEGSFPALYKFYMPWIINIDKSFKIESNFGNDSPFNVMTNFINFKNINFFNPILETEWVHFFINKNVKHMEDSTYGIIDIKTPMYDIIIEDLDVIDKIKKEYNVK
jgi:hypothetical protein